MSPDTPSTPETTQLLKAWRAGDEAALARLSPLIYADLKVRAARALRGERRNLSLQGTELVNEAFLRLVDADVSWQDRAHFLAVAARSMRRILVDRARGRQRQKRGSGRVEEDIAEVQVAAPGLVADREDLLALDTALDELAERFPEKARSIELSFFGGLSLREIAEVTGTSKSAVQRNLDFAKAWLHRRLGS